MTEITDCTRSSPCPERLLEQVQIAKHLIMYLIETRICKESCLYKQLKTYRDPINFASEFLTTRIQLPRREGNTSLTVELFLAYEKAALIPAMRSKMPYFKRETQDIAHRILGTDIPVSKLSNIIVSKQPGCFMSLGPENIVIIDGAQYGLEGPVLADLYSRGCLYYALIG